MMKKFVLYSLALLIPVFVGIPLINYFVDPGHVYSDRYIERVVTGLNEGKNVANITDVNERALQEKFLEKQRGKSFDYAIVGASRVMTISVDNFNGRSVINMGMSGSKIEDLIAVYQLCKEYNIKYKKIIVGVEPTFFNENDHDTRWKYLKGHFDSFMGIKNAIPLLSQVKNIDFSLIKNLFSTSYFKYSIDNIGGLFNKDLDVVYVDTYVNDGGTRRCDGSIYYSKDYRERIQSDIDNESLTWMHGSFKNFKSISVERVKLFKKFIDALLKDGVDIIFFKCPYHPLFYKRIISSTGINMGFKFIDNYAKIIKVRVIGSYNPEDVGFKNTDFYDPAHARKESLDIFLDKYNL